MYFFFKYSATTEIFTFSLHDALPIYSGGGTATAARVPRDTAGAGMAEDARLRKQLLARIDDRRADIERFLHRTRPRRDILDRKSKRLNSSHANISYAVFCLKKNISCTPDPLSEMTAKYARICLTNSREPRRLFLPLRLSNKLLILTLLFFMVAYVLIYIPSL